ncbi:hypothetical protein BOTBODRAFT_145556 [Botryobasidium botryosum FD-172 SS1]|uniref:Protein-S-isoprenylcysteine O-methyltransferase n=1 Tax=Botryobasidium botryosum (strain FD-172 SS1) TaxID=930990 RepID=A0A067MG36_BOTB1|nr:hypothetical protein BOTBODRAFT_145556 [Botryobasidium botryosum FD-172 SS1]
MKIKRLENWKQGAESSLARRARTQYSVLVHSNINASMANSSALLKTLLIPLSVAIQWKCVTLGLQNTPLKKDAVVQHEGVLAPYFVRFIPFFVRWVCIAAAAYELAVIYLYPSSLILERICLAPSFDPTAFNTATAIGLPLSIIGGLLRLQSTLTLGPYFTFPLAIRKDHKLITSGPYSIVRHPGYSSGLVQLLAWAVWQAGGVVGQCMPKDLKWLVWVIIGMHLTLVGGMVVRIGREEVTLGEHFGKEWEAYCKRVPYKLFPGVV